MKRHGSAIAGGRKKNKVQKQKPAAAKSKKLKKSRSRKSMKRRRESLDDMAIERLSKPVDHSALKRRIEREQTIEFAKSKPRPNKLSRSKSAKKFVKEFDKSLKTKYKSFL